MNTQSPLFFESPEEAIAHLVNLLGGAKVVAGAMWPDQSPDNAARRLKDALNTGRSERLKPSQVLYLMRLGREAGFHEVMAYFAQECGYAQPVPVSPVDERDALLREFLDAAARQQAVTERMERLAGQFGWESRLKAVKS